MKSSLVFLAVIVALATAQAEPVTTQPTPSTIPQAVAWKQECAERVAAMKGKCDLIFIGDSITQNFCEYPKGGWNLVGGSIWEKYYARRHALNFGVGGDSTQNALYRMEHMGIENLQPKLAVIMLGMNNQKETPQDIAAGVKAVLEKTKALFPRVKTIVMSVTANGRMPEKTPQINELLKEFADNQTVAYADLYSDMTPAGSGWKGVGGDKVHLTQEGYELWATKIEPMIVSVLGP